MKTRALRWHVEGWQVIPPKSRYGTPVRRRIVLETFAKVDLLKADAFATQLRKRYEDVRMVLR